MLLLVTVGNIAGMTSAQMLHLFQSPSLHSGPERTVLIPGDILSLEHWNRSWSEAGVELEQVIDFIESISDIRLHLEHMMRIEAPCFTMIQALFLIKQLVTYLAFFDPP
jgi:hypothetical protein